ncbi:hypothetical protein HMPREF3033_00111 [Veillonellaceae bacterium DNF00751]|nr:hypothetical protein HMPREF3033_00111 [Veillonellaceae bacterium DNF00751]
MNRKRNGSYTETAIAIFGGCVSVTYWGLYIDCMCVIINIIM